jgi:Kelch motif
MIRFGAYNPPAVRNDAGMDGSIERSRHAARLDDPSSCYVWSRMVPPPVVPPPRSGAASVVVQDKLYIFGGYGGGTGRLDDFWSYSFESGIWEPVVVRSLVKPGCRENNGVVISDDTSRSIYLFGGYNGTRE